MSTDCHVVKRPNLADAYRSACAAIDRLVQDNTRSESFSTPNGGSRSFTYANIAELAKLRDDYARQLAAIGSGRGGGVTFTGVNRV